MNIEYNDPQQFVDFFLALAAAIGACAVAATKSPNKAANKVGQFLLDAINLLGQNYGKAKNSEE